VGMPPSLNKRAYGSWLSLNLGVVRMAWRHELTDAQSDTVQYLIPGKPDDPGLDDLNWTRPR